MVQFECILGCHGYTVAGSVAMVTQYNGCHGNSRYNGSCHGDSSKREWEKHNT